jgi:hypothetical protein
LALTEKGGITMPLKLNVGLNRKVGEANYSSRGANVNVELEVDSSLVSEPAKLQERIRQLFGLVRMSLAEELNGGSNGHESTNSGANASHDNSHRNGGNSDGRGHDTGQRSNPPRPATTSQVKALFAITKSQRLNLNQLLRERFRVGKQEDLTIKEASQLIDQLKNSEDRRGG